MTLNRYFGGLAGAPAAITSAFRSVSSFPLLSASVRWTICVRRQLPALFRLASVSSPALYLAIRWPLRRPGLAEPTSRAAVGSAWAFRVGCEAVVYFTIHYPSRSSLRFKDKELGIVPEASEDQAQGRRVTTFSVILPRTLRIFTTLLAGWVMDCGQGYQGSMAWLGCSAKKLWEAGGPRDYVVASKGPVLNSHSIPARSSIASGAGAWSKLYAVAFACYKPNSTGQSHALSSRLAAPLRSLTPPPNTRLEHDPQGRPGKPHDATGTLLLLADHRTA
ncbi:hypothetical protein CKAH01_12400 [Colletotrichum kahawae]|uniref:Uncharacterized protein n=1 Tax=Colletotrichum kahawae TaxID=34407 RepID=A0AAD9YSE6_COLKA|nr:hypothetical protein CKAH01_12400 [Colletotrichum kahawae]